MAMMNDSSRDSRIYFLFFIFPPFFASEPMSAVARGRAFEQLAAGVLARQGFVLRHCGQAGDGGIDLRGAWHLPGGLVVPVVAQCKDHKLKSGPAHVRELEASVMSLQTRLAANRDWLEPPLRAQMAAASPSPALGGLAFEPQQPPHTLPPAVSSAALAFPPELREARKLIKVRGHGPNRKTS